MMATVAVATHEAGPYELDANEEYWAPVPGFYGMYEVSSKGRVLSCERYVGRGSSRLRVRERILVSSADKTGYRLNALSKGGVPTTVKVHRLVAEVFIGPCPDGYQVAHGDGNKLNNCIDNLRYATPAENAADKKLHGTYKRGEQVCTAKLTERDVHSIRALLADGVRVTDIALAHGVTRDTIYKIKYGQRWGWLEEGDAA